MVLARKILTGLSLLVVVAFGVLLVLSLFVPIYTDEIGSKLQLMRVLVEGGRVVTLVPQCRSTWAQPLPVSWFPAALYYHAFFLPLGLLGHKVSAIVLAMGWFAAIAVAIARTTTDPGARLRRFAVFIALHAAGTVPFAIVTARAEPMIVIALGIFAAFPLAWPIESRKTWWGRMLLAVGFLVLTSILFFSSFKTLFFTPFVLLSAVLTFRRRSGWLAAVAVLAGFTAYQTNAEARLFIGCEEAPIVQSVLRSISLDPKLALHDPSGFVKEGTKNLLGRAVDMADGMAIVAPHPWLPPSTAEHVPALVKAADDASRVLVYGTLLGVPLLVIVATVRAWRRPRARPLLGLAAMLLVCVGGHIFFAHHWNFYMSPLVICVLALVAVLASAAQPANVRESPRLPLVAFGIVLQVTALSVMVTTIGHVGPKLLALSRIEGTVLPGQPAYVPALGFGHERPKIREHAARCGISGDGSRRLVIDDATYFAFDDLHEPLHLIYVTDASMWGYDMPGEKDLQLLRDLRASGIISRCSYFPTLLEKKAKRQDGYCCVGADDLR